MTSENKLVVILLDGFRWDYYTRDKKNLKGFEKLASEGVRVDYLEPIYPVLSYPNWTTISTGVYAENHGITGNYMLDTRQTDPAKAVFNLMENETTAHPHWWQESAEPIWTTATKNGKRTFTRLWSRSDIPFDHVLPEEYSAYAYAPGAREIKDTTDIGVQKLLEGFDFVLLYGEHIDNVGHAYGPDSNEMKEAVKDVDDIILRFLQKLDECRIENVNVVVLSDHGMSWTGENSGTKYLNLEDHIDEEDVHMCLDSGAYISIAPTPGRLEAVQKKLESVEGIQVYRKDEIPEDLHFKNGKFVLDLHIQAKPGYFIRGLQSREKQVPFRENCRSKMFVEGVHGYTPESADQRGIFFARGPAFKRGYMHSAIKMVDVYQMFAKVLGFKPLRNDGDWENVAGMFVEGEIDA